MKPQRKTKKKEWMNVKEELLRLRRWIPDAFILRTSSKKVFDTIFLPETDK